MSPFVEEYLAHGWALVAIPRGKKGPRHEGWNKQENTIVDPPEAVRITGSVGLVMLFPYVSFA